MKNYIPLSQVTKPNLTTAEAAYYMDRQPQTLRIWSCFGNGPMCPLVICGRLAWPVSDVMRVLGVSPEVKK